MSIRDIFLPVLALKHTVTIIVYWVRQECPPALREEGAYAREIPAGYRPAKWVIAPRYCLLLLIGGSVSNSLQALDCDTKQYFDIPSQSLNSALLKFGAETKLTVLFSIDIVDRFESPALKGCKSSEEALGALLAGSGLDYRFVDGHTVTLDRVARLPDNSTLPGPFLLGSINVFAKALNNPDLAGQTGDAVPERAGRYDETSVYSATRTPTLIRNLPQAVRVINRNLLEDQQNVSLSESLANFSGVVPRSSLFTPVVEGTTIRGLRAEQMVDGFSQYYNAGDRESAVNVDRIVVLKGANSVLYSGGAGATPGGLIEIISKQPKSKPFAEAGFKFGSYDFFQPFFDWNQPINEMSAVRVTGEYTKSASPIDVIDTERFSFNPALSLISRDHSTRFTLHGKWSQWRQPEYQGLPATGTLAGDFRIRTKTFIGPADMPESHSNSYALWAQMEHSFNSTWSINLRARHAGADYSEKSQTLVNRFGAIADTPLFAPSIWALLNGELFQKQREFGFVGDIVTRFDWRASENTLLFGGDHSVIDDVGYQDVGKVLGLVDLSAPKFHYAYRAPGPGIEDYSLISTTYGGYVQLQSDIYRRIHTLFAVRLAGIDIESHNSAEPGVTRTEQLKWLPRVGTVLDVSDNLSLFGSYNQGMRGQPYTVFTDAPAPAISEQLEGGIKWEIEGAISGQFALFRIDRSQIAVLQPNSNIFSARGSQRSQGLEADLTWHPWENVDILACYAYTDTRFPESSGTFSKNTRLAWIPEHSGRFWANYRFREESLRGWSAGFGIYARSGAFLANNNQFATGGYHIFDATLAYETPRFHLAATVKNLSDEEYFQPYQYFGNGYSGGGRVVPGQGATVIFSASVRY